MTTNLYKLDIIYLCKDPWNKGKDLFYSYTHEKLGYYKGDDFIETGKSYKWVYNRETNDENDERVGVFLADFTGKNKFYYW